MRAWILITQERLIYVPTWGLIMASLPNVLPIFDEPDGNISLTAIADAIRKTKYQERLTCAELAFHLRCDPSTVKNAENGSNLLRFDIVARLLRKYPQHCAGI
jgi:hypothetical protein